MSFFVTLGKSEVDGGGHGVFCFILDGWNVIAVSEGLFTKEFVSYRLFQPGGPGLRSDEQLLMNHATHTQKNKKARAIEGEGEREPSIQSTTRSTIRTFSSRRSICAHLISRLLRSGVSAGFVEKRKLDISPIDSCRSIHQRSEIGV